MSRHPVDGNCSAARASDCPRWRTSVYPSLQGSRSRPMRARAYMTNGGELPAGLEEEILEHIERLERVTGSTFGDPANPLLVSVRSGAAISMPGMMDSILDLGLNDEAVRGLAAATGNARFAHDSYRRLIQMYGGGRRRASTLTGSRTPSRRSGGARSRERRRSHRRRTCKLADRALQARSTSRRRGTRSPTDAHEQLMRAVRAVLRLVELATGVACTGTPTRSPTTSGPRST